MTDKHGFGEVITMLKQGRLFARDGWNGKDMYIKLQEPDEHSKMQLPYIYMNTADDKFVPWVASHTDILSGDWYEVIGVTEKTNEAETDKSEENDG